MIYIISTRKGFTSGHEFASAGQVRAVEKDLPLLNWPVEAADFLQRVAGGRLLMVVHGFNASAGDMLAEAETIRRRIQRRVPGVYDHLVVFTWPGGASQRDYFAAKRRVREAGSRLGVWLRRLMEHGARVDLLTHSMGARLAHVALAAASPSVRIERFFALAPAVGWNVLSSVGAAAALVRVGRLYVFCSRRDRVLGRWFPLFEWRWALGAAGPKNLEALQRRWPGLEVVAVKDCGHCDYVEAPAVYDAMARAAGQSLPTRSEEATPARASAAGMLASPLAPVPA